MINFPQDVSLLLPVELLDSLAKVVNEGIQRANIPPADRKEIAAWWEAEYSLIQDSLGK